jgi:hypothetical protein
MSKINDRKIRYVSIDPSAFLLGPQFMALNLHQRGLYISMLLYLCVNNGTIPADKSTLKRIIGYRVGNFEKYFASISHLFTSKGKKLYSPLVNNALKRANMMRKLQSAKGVSSAKARGYKSEEPNPVEPSEAKRSQEKISEVKKSEEKTIKDVTRDSCLVTREIIIEPRVTRDEPQIKSIGSVLANSSSLMPRSASPSVADVTMLQIKFYDQLCRIFSKRTPADSSSLHNLTGWVKQQISAGRWTMDIFGRILDIARQSIQGRPRKPLAVFYSQLKTDLGYKCIDPGFAGR